jgi:hypothetical protein
MLTQSRNERVLEVYQQMRGAEMLVIVGLIVLLVAAIIAIVGVLSNARAAHPLTDFSVFGYHLTGSTGTLFLFGIAVGAVASLGLCLLLAGAWRTASRSTPAVAPCDLQAIRRYGYLRPRLKSTHALPI